MASYRIIFTIGIAVFLTVICFASFSEAGGNGKGKGKKHTCLREEVNLPEEYITASKDCWKELKAKKEEYVAEEEDASTDKKKQWKDARCFQACVYRKFGLIVDESKPEFDTAKFEEIINVLPETARESMKDDIPACFENVEPLSDEDDCSSHAKYQKCIWSTWSKHCGWDKKKDNKNEQNEAENK